MTLDKSVYVAFSVFDLSKLLMYEFRYVYVKKRMCAYLFYTDTGSLVYDIKTDYV